MKYEYTSITIVEEDKYLINDHSKILNKWFAQGWEYVDQLQQRIGGAPSYQIRPAIIVILRREKQTDLLN